MPITRCRFLSEPSLRFQAPAVACMFSVVQLWKDLFSEEAPTWTDVAGSCGSVFYGGCGNRLLLLAKLARLTLPACVRCHASRCVSRVHQSSAAAHPPHRSCARGLRRYPAG